MYRIYLHFVGGDAAGFRTFMHPVMRVASFSRLLRILAAIPQSFAAKRRKNRKKLACIAVLTLSIPSPARRKRAG
jgi:hypothetical protein